MARKNAQNEEVVETPAVTPETPPEETPVAEAELSYPGRGRDTEALMARWKEQRRVRCCHKTRDGYPGTCVYPLNVFRDKNRETVAIQTDEGPAVRAVCSWDSRHVRDDGSPQFILLSDLKAAEEK